MQHLASFCSWFPTLKHNLTQFLCSFRLHTKWDKTATHQLIKPVIKIKQNVLSTLIRMACETNGQVARSLKQHLKWPMHWWFMDKFWECFEHTTYTEVFLYLYQMIKLQWKENKWLVHPAASCLTWRHHHKIFTPNNNHNALKHNKESKLLMLLTT
jgi:hypothetical protein